MPPEWIAAFNALLVALGTVAFALTAAELWRGWRARGWPTTPGEVLEVGTRYQRARRGGYVADVRYGYTVDGAHLTGTRLRFGWQALHPTTRGAERELRGLAPGARVAVCYNPRRPGDAVLRPGPSFADVLALVVGAALVAGGLHGRIGAGAGQ